ncbi:ATP-binding cassette domain-containing protein, partial [Ursidibacter sp. B-7004-1]
EIKIEIENLKNIKNLQLTLPICKGVYAITGSNGVGKSTTLNVLAKLVYKGALNSYFKFDGNQNSKITYYYQDKINRYIRAPQQWIVDNKDSRNSDEIYFKGLYEGSLIYGNRFSDAHKDLLTRIRKFKPEDSHCVIADEDIIKSISKILGNKSNSYENLYRFKSREYAKKQGFKNTPYFIK